MSTVQGLGGHKQICNARAYSGKLPYQVIKKYVSYLAYYIYVYLFPTGDRFIPVGLSAVTIVASRELKKAPTPSKRQNKSKQFGPDSRANLANGQPDAKPIFKVSSPPPLFPVPPSQYKQNVAAHLHNDGILSIDPTICTLVRGVV